MWLKQRADRPTDKWKRYTATSLWDAVEGKPGELAFRAEYAPVEETQNIVGLPEENLRRIRTLIANIDRALAKVRVGDLTG